MGAASITPLRVAGLALVGGEHFGLGHLGVVGDHRETAIRRGIEGHGFGVGGPGE
jgi:predicted acylesterase/phospholipase RssA